MVFRDMSHLPQPLDFQGYNPADRIPALFQTPKLSLTDTLFLRFGVVSYEVAPHILVVDLSHWNGDVIWAMLRGSGVVAVILKCSEGAENTYYEYKDVKFEMFWQQALDWGFPVMLYHFFRGGKGSAEFNWFMKCADVFLNDTRILGKTAVWLDCEWKPPGLARSTYTNRAFGFTTLTTERSMENGIYSSPGLVPQLFDPAYTKWATVNQWNAHWTAGADTLPPGWSEEKRNARQRGIYDTHWWVEKVLGAGKVDINHMFYANETALREWLGQGIVKASPSSSPSPSPSASPSPVPPNCCDEHRVWLNQLEDKQIALTHRVNTLEAGQHVLTTVQQEQAEQIDGNTENIEQLRNAILNMEASYLELYLKYDKVRKAFCDE